MRPAPRVAPRKAVILLSGGLDSTLAARMLQEQGIGLHAIHFTSPFCTCSGNGGCRSQAHVVAGRMGIPIRTVSKGEEYLEIVKSPRHGRGSAMNPCIDCRIFTLRKARSFMDEIGASFLVTGEVVGQRPMSQRDDALRSIERHSGCSGLVLRPLSARHLPPTLPEREGWVDRDRFLAITGRSRKEQIRLAASFGIGDYPCPAGGCLLTERGFSAKVRDLIENEPDFRMHDVHLLKAGRHFRARGIRAIVAKSEEENRRLEALCRGKEAVYVSDSHPGPSVAMFGGCDADRLDLLSRILTRYSKAGVPGPYVVREVSPHGVRILTVPENRDFREVERGLLS
ncbi:MAG: thiamine biosynthesis protein [Deltaproteobacteria bacterium]|jgi:tRNA U34 2-thiouridine synthase MnmA/TrmU|nr:thiamine biosynthesis protein [Deltaproteobacteria bacterium]